MAKNEATPPTAPAIRHRWIIAALSPTTFKKIQDAVSLFFCLGEAMPATIRERLATILEWWLHWIRELYCDLLWNNKSFIVICLCLAVAYILLAVKNHECCEFFWELCMVISFCFTLYIKSYSDPRLKNMVCRWIGILQLFAIGRILFLILCHSSRHRSSSTATSAPATGAPATGAPATSAPATGAPATGAPSSKKLD